MDQEQERDLATVPRQRDRRSREDVSKALVKAAAVLASERGSLSATVVGYALLGGYIRHSAGLDGHSDDEVEAMVVEVLHDLAALTFSATAPVTRS